MPDIDRIAYDLDAWLNEPFEPYDVTCARCGKVLLCTDAVIEEGDEWECWPCNERCDEQERIQRLNGTGS